MSMIAEGIKDLLVTAAVGVFNGTNDQWNINIGKTIEEPDNCITIRQTGGTTPNPKWLLDYPSIQVIVRSGPNGFRDAWNKAQSVKNVLLGLPSQDLNGDRWVQVNMMGDVSDIGQDEKRRPRVSVNFRLIIEPAASADSHRLPLSS